MNYYREETTPNSVVYTTTSYNVNPSHQKGRNRLKLFPRFSRKKAAPQPLVVDHSVKVTQSGYGGVVYPSGYTSEKYQISQQSPGARSNSVCVNDSIDSLNKERVTYYESNYTPNTFSHEKYYCPPPPVSSCSSTNAKSNRVHCQPIQPERLRSYQQQQQQQQQEQYYNEDSNLINNRQQYNSYGGTSSTSGHTSININNNVNHINEDYNYNSTNNNNNNNNNNSNNYQQQQHYNQPPSNVENFIYPPGYLENQQQQQHSYEYHEENHQYSTNHQQQQQHQQCEPVYPMGIEQQNWNFTTQNISTPYNY